MGPQRVLQAAGLIGALGAAICSSAVAHAAPRLHERVAVIDLGPDDGGVIRRDLATSIVAAGLDPVIGDGIEDALAGQNVDKDALELAAAIAQAQRAFGALDCAAAITAGERAIALAAMRQAAGLPVPELARALTYVLLCKDKAGDTDGAMVTAARLRVVGGSGDVSADIWRKYPDVDTIVDRELVPLEITADTAGAVVWIDLQPVGAAPVKVQLPAGEHLIAVAAGTKRGWASGHTDPKQTTLTIPTTDRAGGGSAIAVRIASWQGARPAVEELAWVLGETRARVVLIRRGDTVEAWGHAGRAETPHVLGGDDGTAKVADDEDVARLLALVADRVQSWNGHAPDPDQPLLVERAGDRDRLMRDRNPPTRWWVYATLAGAVLGAAAIIYANDGGPDRQRVELTFP